MRRLPPTYLPDLAKAVSAANTRALRQIYPRRETPPRLTRQTRGHAWPIFFWGRCCASPAIPSPRARTPPATTAHGAVLVDDGRIVAVGTADDLRARHPQARVTDYGRALISAGFIDAHVHYPQTAIIASWGKRLIDWLNHYTFPEEMRFADPAYAETIANRYLDLVARPRHHHRLHLLPPSTPPAWMPSSPPPSRAGCALYAGKTCMDRNAPDGLRDTAQSAYDDSKAPAGEMARAGPRCTMSSPPAFRPPLPPSNWRPLARCGANTPTA